MLSAVMIDTEGTVFAASCWYRLILKDSDSAEGIVMLLGLEFSKIFAFVV
jgi:ethanolamine utilization protein EutP (predicted NTPase)